MMALDFEVFVLSAVSDRARVVLEIGNAIVPTFI
jgi:hypothetical protein